MRLHFRAHAGEAEKYAIEGPARVGVYIDNGSGDAAAFELIEEFTSPSQKEEDEDYITETVGCKFGMLNCKYG